MPGTTHALDRTIRWDPYLHRMARCTGCKLGQQHPYRVPQVGTLRFGTRVKSFEDTLNCHKIRECRGHDGTIRPEFGLLYADPAFRDTTRQGIVATVHPHGGAKIRKAVGT